MSCTPREGFRWRPLPDCIFKTLGNCTHPKHHGKTDDARCAACQSYTGSPRGLGDIVHTIAKATGAEAVVNAVTGGNCKCPQRRAALNAAVPFTDKPKEG